jgi:hypothetical protein
VGEHLIRDLFEVLIVVAVGGMLVSAIVRLRRGQIRAFRCPSCDRPTSRAFPQCRWCGELLRSGEGPQP